MLIEPIKTEEDYKTAVADIERLFEMKKSAEDYDRLDVLATLVEAYEAKHYPMGPSGPITQ